MLSTHYIFDLFIPAFTQLATQNSPPSIYGCAVAILLDGRLLVFGVITGGQLGHRATTGIRQTGDALAKPSVVPCPIAGLGGGPAHVSA